MIRLTVFWDWFYEHRAIYFDLQALPEGDQAYYYQALSDRLEAFGSTLGYVIKFADPGACAELTLTTNGHAEGVILVQNLVDLAPDIPNWRITAFIQPTMAIDMLIERTDPPYHFNELSIKASDIVWLPESFDPDTGKYVLVFGFINLTSTLQTIPIEKVNNYITGIVLDLLGELLACKTIATVYYDLLRAKDGDGWFCLYELPVYLKEGW